MNSVLVPRGLMLSAVLIAAAPAAFAQIPANDAFANAQAVTAGVVTAGTNLNATVEGNEPPTHWTLTYAAGAATGRSVWYSYTPPTSGIASFSVVAQGTGTAAAALQAAAYSGAAINSLTRIASASSAAGAAGPPATAGVAFPSNLFAVTAGTPVYIQITGNSATGTTPFNLTVTPFSRTGSVILPRYSNWEWLHPLTATPDPTAAATWAGTWKIPGDLTDYGTPPTVLKFSAPAPAPLGFAALDGAPGVKTDITTIASGANNNAAYARTTFTLANASSNLWAEVFADDGAYIYIDGLPGVPVHIAAGMTGTAAAPVFLDYRPQKDAFLSGTLATGCRAYVPAGFNVERNTKMVFLGGIAGTLAAGQHRIAVSLHQTANTSSDMAFDMQLIDMGAYRLSQGTNAIDFTDVPFVPVAANAVIAAEHHFAPSALTPAGLAWHSVSPDAPTAAKSSFVASDAISDNQKALRFRNSMQQRFVTEPINVDGLPQVVASLRIRTHDTGTAFEPEDGFRVVLETSTDGITFAEPAPPLEIQPQVNGAAAYTPFQDIWVTKSLTITPNPHKYVRMVITGGTDSDNEYIHFDDIRFGQCQVFPVTTPVTYFNNNTNDRSDDTVTFNLSATASGNVANTWVTTGLAPTEAAGTFGAAAQPITRAAESPAGAARNIVFTVSEEGDPACSSVVTVPVPAAAIGTITVTNPVRDNGANPDSTADDTFTYTVLVDGSTAVGVTYEIRSSDTGNTTLYGTGTYGTAGTVTVPASEKSIIIRDLSVPVATPLQKAAAVPPVGVQIAMGRTVLGGVSKVLYSNPTATAVVSKWAQATGTEVTPVPTDLGITVNDTTTVFRPAVALATPDEGVMESPAVDVTGIPNVVISASLRAFEDSTTTGFETADTFKIEVIEETAGGNNTINLITGNLADLPPANNLLNGTAATPAANYDLAPGSDEFNKELALAAAHSRGTFNFTRQVSPAALRVRVKVTGANDSANEFFYLQNVLITDAPPNPTVDSDGDGQTDVSEQFAGTDPQNPNSVLRITSSQLTGNEISLTFPSVVNKKYIAQSSTDLTNWTDIVASQVTATGTTTTIAALPGVAGRDFFRIRVVP